MTKLSVNKPVLFMMLGLPGAGKTFFARQLGAQNAIVHLQMEQLRSVLYRTPDYSNDENQRLHELMAYMAETLLSRGVSVIYDGPLYRRSDRHALQQVARKAGAQPLVVWVQIDQTAGFDRAAVRDRRKIDDRFSREYEFDDFDAIAKKFKNPDPTEQSVVISGKHLFRNQFRGVLAKLHALGLFDIDPPKSEPVQPRPVIKAPRRLHMDMPRRRPFRR